MRNTNPRLSKGFGQVSNEVMRDPELSLKDKGLYSYLCTFAGSQTNELIVSVTVWQMNVVQVRPLLKEALKCCKPKVLLIEYLWVKVTLEKPLY